MIQETFAWWLVVEGIGLIALPIGLVVFQSLPGRGYAFAKPLGILLGAYLFWMALSLHLLPNRPGSIVWAYVPVALVSLYIVKERAAELRAAIEERAGLIIAVEVVFTFGFFIAAHLRSFLPDIAGTEKPMDFMLLNTASRSRYYPPDDAWLSGFAVSYYYFGYVIQAMFGKLAAVKTSVAFNLGLASTAALAMTAAFGLGYEIASLARGITFRAAVVVGGFAILLVTVLGNLEGAVEFGVANGFVSRGLAQDIDIANLAQAGRSQECLVNLFGSCFAYPNEHSSFWWWWRATRISPDANSITEFPFFSFLLGDLHPHVMAIPYVLTVAGLALAFWRATERLDFAYWRARPALLLVSGLLVGGLGFLNTWDLPTFGFLVTLFVVGKNLLEGRDVKGALLDSTSFMLPLALLALVLYAPFYSSFSSQASGIEAVRGEATRPLHSALFWLPLVMVTLPLPVVLLAGDARARRWDRVISSALVPVALILLWALLVVANHGGSALGEAISDRGANWLTTLFFAGALVVCILALWQALDTRAGEADAALAPVLMAMTAGVLLILGGELFYVKDVFGSRLNTVFKLYYQAWLLLGVCGAFGLYWLTTRWRPAPQSPGQVVSGAWSAIASVCLAAAMLYPIGATLSRTDGLARADRTLDGLAFTSRESPEDVVAINWLRERADPGENVAEAVGGQYSPFARVSAWTGVPSVIGWPGHEVQWGRDGRLINLRADEIERVYTAPSLAEALAILRKYRVTYVFVGSQERAKYGSAALQKFETGLPLAFQAGQTAVYRLPLQPPALTRSTE